MAVEVGLENEFVLDVDCALHYGTSTKCRRSALKYCDDGHREEAIAYILPQLDARGTVVYLSFRKLAKA